MRECNFFHAKPSQTTWVSKLDLNSNVSGITIPLRGIGKTEQQEEEEQISPRPGNGAESRESRKQTERECEERKRKRGREQCE